MVIGISLALLCAAAALFATDLAEAAPVPVPLMNGEQLFSPSGIAARLPGYRNNSHVNSSTVFRWITRGVKTADGRTVRLQAVRLGLAWKTSLEAVARFSEALTAAALPADEAPALAPAAAPTPKARDRAARRASEELAERLG